MKILMLVRGEYKSDIRIRREAEGLVEAGHHVRVICHNADAEKDFEQVSGVDITSVSYEYKNWARFIEGIYAVSWYHPILLWKIRNLLSEQEYDVVYYHDIHYAKVATQVSKWFNLKIVADLHEMYPQDVETWRKSFTLSEKLHPRTLLKPVWRFQRLERFAVTHADVLVTVSQGLLDYFIERYNFDESGVVIRNVPDLKRLDAMPIQSLDYPEEFVISYIGGFTPQRGLETIIEAMPEILQTAPDTRLLLIGDGTEAYVGSLKKLCRDVGVRDNVEFTGWVEFEKVRSYYEASDVSLVPIYETHSGNDVLPNKLFQSMAFRTPVVVSNHPSMSQIVNESGAGVVFDENKTLSDAVLSLYQNPEKQREMGERGRKAVEAEYNIDAELEGLLDVFKRLE
ncbi:glycosyltransferase [Halosegnis longus]|uniref:glycosyltransferase n=1 Tax=Halosegnis longus TaxID=2216012 RepID=UPI00096AC121|nr:glycosyltransferase family 4 protein [Salella cibi]